MAKKTEKKVVTPKKEKDMVEKIEWGEAHNLLVDEIETLGQRIDRIVNAIDKSKKVRGL